VIIVEEEGETAEFEYEGWEQAHNWSSL